MIVAGCFRKVGWNSSLANQGVGELPDEPRTGALGRLEQRQATHVHRMLT